MATQEIIEHLGTDSGEESDGATEDVCLAVQVIRLQLLLTKSTFDEPRHAREHHCLLLSHI